MKVIRDPRLSQMDGIEHAFFTRDGGFSVGAYKGLNAAMSAGDSAEAVSRNRAAAAAFFGVAADHLVLCKQVHSLDVITIDAPQTGGERPTGDALVTNKAGLMLGIMTADCAPVLFADETARIVAVAHAGWRGALGGILENTIAAMERLGAKREAIAAAVGPCIGQASYEVSADYAQPFLAKNPENSRFFAPAQKADHLMFDLPAFVRASLLASGLRDPAPSPADTCADAACFYSYRRSQVSGEGETGRLLSAIMLKE